ncbi:MAG: hypothetical protein DRP68_07445, partial [Candidatus Omnitrophota bacterium]
MTENYLNQRDNYIAFLRDTLRQMQGRNGLNLSDDEEIIVTPQMEKYINILLKSKKYALKKFIERSGISKNEILIVADQIFGIDRDILTSDNFKECLRINVGEVDENINDKNLIQGIKGIWATKEILELLKLKLLGVEEKDSNFESAVIDWVKVFEKLNSYKDSSFNVSSEEINSAWRRIVRDKLKEKILEGLRCVNIKGEISLEDIVASRIALDIGDDRLVTKENRLKCLENLLKAVKWNVIEKKNDLLGRIDLHHHTTYSDGAKSATGVVFEAWLRGMRAIGITDHNNLEAMLEAVEAWEKIKKIFPHTDFEVIPGVEFSVYCDDDNLKINEMHILAYFPIDERVSLRKNFEEFKNWLNNNNGIEEMRKECEKRIEWQNNKIKYMMERLRKGEPIDERSKFSVPQEKLLIDKDEKFLGFNINYLTRFHLENILKEKYGLTPREAFENISLVRVEVEDERIEENREMGENYNGRFGFSLEEIYNFVREQKGAIVIAHPWDIMYVDKDLREEVEREVELQKEAWREEVRKEVEKEISKGKIKAEDKEKEVNSRLRKKIERTRKGKLEPFIEATIERLLTTYPGYFDGIEVYKYQENIRNRFMKLITTINKRYPSYSQIFFTAGSDSHSRAGLEMGIGRRIARFGESIIPEKYGKDYTFVEKLKDRALPLEEIIENLNSKDEEVKKIERYEFFGKGGILIEIGEDEFVVVKEDNNNFINQLFNQLSQRGVPVPQIEKTIQIDGENFIVYKFIEGRTISFYELSTSLLEKLAEI